MAEHTNEMDPFLRSHEALLLYFKRIKLSPLAPLLPTLHLLQSLIVAHQNAVPFEFFDCLLGRGLSVDISAIFEKIVRQGRGGFCYESNSLFFWALTHPSLNFTARRALNRVLVDSSPAALTPLTHMCILVTFPSSHGVTEYMADVAFGAESPPGPLRLFEGKSTINGVTTDGKFTFGEVQCFGNRFFRFREDPLHRAIPDAAFVFEVFQPTQYAQLRDSGKCQSSLKKVEVNVGLENEVIRLSESIASMNELWTAVYVGDRLTPVFEADIEVGAYYCATNPKPSNIFQNSRWCVIHGPANGETRVLNGKDLKVKRYILSKEDEPVPTLEVESRVIESEEEYFYVIDEEFGICLSWDWRNGETKPIAEKDFEERVRLY